MRHNDARKWLHAVLDLLPVILIPVFMIFSHRHDVASTTSYTEEVPVYYETNEVNGWTDLINGNIYSWNDNYTLTTSEGTNILVTLVNNETLVNEYGFTYNDDGLLQIAVNTSGCYLIYRYTGYSNNILINGRYIEVIYQSTNNSTFDPLLYEHFTITQRKLVKEYQEVVTTFDKDIMGAFIDNFNFTINKYFNMGNIFNMNNVYQWFETNIFGGTAPTVIYSVWNIVLYEFVMDLLFLLYGLFMWFIDMCKKLMEKPLNSIK